MSVVKNKNGRGILLAMVHAIQQNKQLLGDVDGLIGDGDHGMNMNKGFTVFETRFADKDFSFTEGLDELGMILLNEIGGSMGPLYGTFFGRLARTVKGKETLDLPLFSDMKAAALDGIQSLGGAKVGDKTLVDTLTPAVESLKKSVEAGDDFSEALNKMEEAAEAGKESTKDLVAKLGRASRLGERSRGVLDAGATSCCLIIKALSQGIKELLQA